MRRPVGVLVALVLAAALAGCGGPPACPPGEHSQQYLSTQLTPIPAGKTFIMVPEAVSAWRCVR